MKAVVPLLLFLFVCGNNLSAQNNDYNAYLKQRQEELDKYKSKQIIDFEAYRDRINSEFAEFMSMPWEKKERKAPLVKPKDEVPDVPPIVLPDLDEIEIPEDNEIIIKDIKPLVIDDKPIPIAPVKYKPKPSEKTISVMLYGTKCMLRFDVGGKKHMQGTNEKAAAKYWSFLSSGDYDNLLADCLAVKDRIDLCDWAYYKLLSVASEFIYGKTNEGVLLCAWLMNQSGFDLRLGRTQDNSIHLMLQVSEGVLGYTYYVLNGHNYYLFEKGDLGSMYIFDRGFPGAKPLRLTLTESNKFDRKVSKERVLKSRRYPDVVVSANANMNLLELYSDYPQAFSGGDSRTTWSIYANAPVSAELKNTVYPRLRKAIEGKSQAEAANILLNFVQTAFDYKVDNDAWGYERAFFPEETVYYPFSDCEDRAILFSRLVRDIMKRDAILLYYPGHLATAVEFSETIPGDYIIIAGHRYLVCDPTFINAEIGRTMPGMDNSKAYVVLLK